MAVKIKIKQKEDQKVKLKIGDWVLVKSKTFCVTPSPHICIIALISNDLIKLICIGENDCNRMREDGARVWMDDEGFLTPACIAQLLHGYNFEKLNVEITATVI